MNFSGRSIALDAICGSVQFYKVDDLSGFFHVSANTDLYAAYSVNGKRLIIEAAQILAFKRELALESIFDALRRMLLDHGYELEGL